MRCPGWLYRWMDDRGSIPFWVKALWPEAHWCSELDFLLLVDAKDLDSNCCCSRRKPRS